MYWRACSLHIQRVDWPFLMLPQQCLAAKLIIVPAASCRETGSFLLDSLPGFSIHCKDPLVLVITYTAWITNGVQKGISLKRDCYEHDCTVLRALGHDGSQ